MRGQSPATPRHGPAWGCPYAHPGWGSQAASECVELHGRWLSLRLTNVHASHCAASVSGTSRAKRSQLGVGALGQTKKEKKVWPNFLIVLRGSIVIRPCPKRYSTSSSEGTIEGLASNLEGQVRDQPCTGPTCYQLPPSSVPFCSKFQVYSFPFHHSSQGGVPRWRTETHNHTSINPPRPSSRNRTFRDRAERN